jgi:hypothetical protein
VFRCPAAGGSVKLSAGKRQAPAIHKNKYRTFNVQYRRSVFVYFVKKTEQSATSFRHSIFCGSLLMKLTKRSANLVGRSMLDVHPSVAKSAIIQLFPLPDRSILYQIPYTAGTGSGTETASDAKILIDYIFIVRTFKLPFADRVLGADRDANAAIPTGTAGRAL